MTALPASVDPWPVPRPTGPVQVTVTLPGSKSLTNRALLLAASRTPWERAGDLDAQVGANVVGVARLARFADAPVNAAERQRLVATVSCSACTGSPRWFLTPIGWLPTITTVTGVP